MPSAREVKNRIRSIKNIGQITRALEAVSASRVRRAQARVLASRAFAEKAWEILLNVQSSAQKGTPLHPLLTPRADVKKAMMIVVTSDRGLAGAFNTNIIRAVSRFSDRLGVPVEYVTIGRKGRDSMIRQRRNVIAEFSNPAEATVMQIVPAVQLAIDAFLSGDVDEVFVAYTDFINTLTQRPTVTRLLPLTPYETEDQVAAEYIKAAPQVTAGALDYEYEPSAAGILEEIVPRFTQLQLYQAVLESQASEHSSRMVAMRNASDNAAGLAEDLTLVYNKARQAGITSEILDIVGGAEALQATIDKAADQILVQFQQQKLREFVQAGRAAHTTNGAAKTDGAGAEGATSKSAKGKKPSLTSGVMPNSPLAFAPSPAASSSVASGSVTAPSPEADTQAAVAEMDAPAEAAEEPATTMMPAISPAPANQPEDAPTTVIPVVKPAKAVKQDDLTAIEGIGKKVAGALRNAGIDTWAKLSAASESELQTALEGAGIRFTPSLSTWSRQAEIAMTGDWDALKQYQATLTGGRNS